MKHRNPLTVALLVALMLPLGLFASPEGSGTLHLDGILLLRGDHAAMGRVIITPLNAPGSVMENVEGHFTLDLRLQRTYMLSFERSGMVTKRVYFDTNLPEEELARRFEFPFQVTLFTEGVNGIWSYDGPVGYVYYVSELADFVHRTEYLVAPGSKDEEQITELMRKVVATTVRSIPASTTVVADLKWVKHGKRGSLYIGKAYGPDGRLLAEGQFLDAALREMHGGFVYYHGNGQVESKGRYEHGRKTGVWQRFDAAGIPLAERIYDPEVMERVERSTAGTAQVQVSAAERDFVMHGSAQRMEKFALPAAHATAPTLLRSTSRSEGSVRPAANTVVPVKAMMSGGQGGASALPVDANADTHAEHVTVVPDQGRTEELIVERLRVITVVRLQEITGHTTEYRRVADRHGSVMYFEDGRNIPASIYHARTGR